MGPPKKQADDLLLESFGTDILLPHFKMCCAFFVLVLCIFTIIKLYSRSAVVVQAANFFHQVKPSNPIVDRLFQQWDEDWKLMTNRIRVALDSKSSFDHLKDDKKPIKSTLLTTKKPQAKSQTSALYYFT